MERTKRKLLAPSKRAASSTSSGTAATKPRSIQMANGILKPTWTNTSEPSWFRPTNGMASPALRSRKKSGMVRASTGTICETRMMISSLVRILKL
ncbi:hypothetical protein D3C87_1976250 [compost metagenome]